LTACVALTLGSSGVAAAHASAASIAVQQACVVNANPASGAPMTVAGAGFTPSDTIGLQTTAGGANGTVMAGPTGTFTTVMKGPVLGTANPAAALFTLQAMDETDGTTTASTTFHAANLAVATNPLQASPSKKVTWSFSGFTAGAEIYGHYLHGKKVTATTKFGRGTGPCGTLKKRAVFYPGKAKYDVYTLQIDDMRRYLANALPRLVATLRTHIPIP
jgi:hypothetical protein